MLYYYIRCIIKLILPASFYFYNMVIKNIKLRIWFAFAVHIIFLLDSTNSCPRDRDLNVYEL